MLSHKTELQQKYKNNASFMQEVKETNKKYDELLQRALYSDLQQISPKTIVEAGKDDENNTVFFIFGRQQPTKKKSVDKFYLYLINFLDQKINQKENQPFSIVYFNTCCQSYNNYNIFRTIYRTLPLKYFQHLKKMIIVDPSFTIKAMEWFVTGTINKLLHNSLVYVYNLRQLKNHHVQLTTNKLGLLPKYVKQQKEKEISRLSVRNSLHTRIIKKEPEKRKQLRKLKLQEYEVSEIGVPLALHLMISYFQLHEDALKEEGLFRKSVVKSEIDQAMAFLEQKYYDFLEQITNPHIVSNLITRFIRQLEQPLIPYSIYEKIIHDNGKSNQIFYLKQIFSELPLKNHVTLQYFFDFLLEKVVPFKEFNKMTIYNVAVVMAPCILRSGKELAIEELMYSKKLVIVVEFILNNYEGVFGSKQQRLVVLRQSIKAQKTRFIQQTVEGACKQQEDQQDQSEQEGFVGVELEEVDKQFEIMKITSQSVYFNSKPQLKDNASTGL